MWQIYPISKVDHEYILMFTLENLRSRVLQIMSMLIAGGNTWIYFARKCVLWVFCQTPIVDWDSLEKTFLL